MVKERLWNFRKSIYEVTWFYYGLFREGFYESLKALSPHGSGENVYGQIYRRIIQDRKLENDYRLRFSSGQSVAFFRGSGGVYIPDYRHEVSY